MKIRTCDKCSIVGGDDLFRNRNRCNKCVNKLRYELKKKYMKDPEYLKKYRAYDAMRIKIKRKNADPRDKFIENLRALIRKSFKSKSFKKDSKTFAILGIDKEGFMRHIETQFKEGMTWENHSHNGWHVDHIIPVSLGDTKEEIVKLNHYTNLQPLWSQENWEKGNKIL